MAQVLCLSSQTVWGPVGNSAAVPPLQAAGHEVLQLPTVVLSNHPGHGRPQGQAMPAALLQQMLEALFQLGALAACGAVMTGYFASAEQVAVAAGCIWRLKAENAGLHVLVDPVMGDGNALYVPQPVAEAIRDALLPLATITTPNLFELGWLTGRNLDPGDLQQAVAALDVAEVIVTSVPGAPHELGAELWLAGQRHAVTGPRHPMVPHGTGDHLAGLYLASRLTQAPQPAFASAMHKLQLAISRSLGSRTLSVNG